MHDALGFITMGGSLEWVQTVGHWIAALVDFILHIDRHLQMLTLDYGPWVYGILFLIVFGETGLVVLPLLPGDSLLFAAGALAGTGALDLPTVAIVLAAAATCGDSTNYWIGHLLGPRVFHATQRRWLNREYLDRTQHFYDRHGRKTILFARFIPIIRTFAPFVAGIGRMPYLRFVTVSLAATTAWIVTFVGGGFLFGNIPAVKRHFTLVIFAIILLSIAPAAWHAWRQRAARASDRRSIAK